MGMGVVRWSQGEGWGMAYGEGYAKSAKRHLCAADKLLGVKLAGERPGCRAVAGYLFGLSGELAVKAIMRDSGIEKLEKSLRKDDPYYAHFPNLRTLLKNTKIRGRRAGELTKIVGNSSLFQCWDVAMRYAPTDNIEDRWVEAWQKSAKELVARMAVC
jgi:hypothetical protein